MRKALLFLAVSLSLVFSGFVSGGDCNVSKYDVIWNTPSENSSGSMPIGNGELGLNVWAENNGELAFYISKTDTWDNNCRLLKLGGVRISLKPNPLESSDYFCQRLNLQTGCIEIGMGSEEKRASFNVWVDANNLVANVEFTGKVPYEVKVEYNNWRKEKRLITGVELFSAYGVTGDSTMTVYSEPDVILNNPAGISWYHRNAYSCYKRTMELQGLSQLLSKYPDPLINRTFGGLIKSQELSKKGNTTLVSPKPLTNFTLSVYTLTEQTASPDIWIGDLSAMIKTIEKKKTEKLRSEHIRWWKEFWNRSWIEASGGNNTDYISQGYALQNWINACGGRGNYPIKFNGTIFTVDANFEGHNYDADYRSWGGGYWFQNTRLPYWSMLAAGNYDMMDTLFGMFTKALPLAKDRTELYYGHKGAFYPETQYFWGTYVNDNYGYDREKYPLGLLENRYIRYHWEGGIEMAVIMYEYYMMTGDEKFLKNALIPFSKEIIAFYDGHYKKNSAGKMRMEPAQALETYWDSVDPLPEIAGLTYLLDSLLKIDRKNIGEGLYGNWIDFRKTIPEIPLRTYEGVQVISPAGEIGEKGNMENPELYAIFPFPLYCLGKDNLELAKNTFNKRQHKDSCGWQQSAIDAAMLGLTDTAAEMVTGNFTTKNPGSRFPAFWGPNFDWVPDQDHGSVAMTALQRMLMQTDGKKIMLLPAWPKDWNVSFKLHAPYKTTVECVYENGTVKELKVEPSGRKKDIEIMIR